MTRSARAMTVGGTWARPHPHLHGWPQAAGPRAAAEAV